MATNSGKFYIGTDTKLTIEGLQAEDGTYLDEGATVVGSVLTPSGGSVANATDLGFEYVEGSDGNFEAYLPANAALKEGTKYSLRVVVTFTGRQMTIIIKRDAVYITG